MEKRYGQRFLRWTPLGLALLVHLKEVSVLWSVKEQN